MAQLGTIPQMLLPVMMTLTRGNPPVKETKHIEMTFESVALDASVIKAYSDFCGFETSVPASWLYCLAQRAQIRLMLEASFPLPAPGMVHITNTLEMFATPDISKPVSIYASAEIPGKQGGSLFPQFTVDITQGGTKIAHITSGYIVKRGGGEKATETSSSKPNTTPKQLDFSAAKDGGKIVMPDSIGWDYAKVSGDFNPIHIAGFAAKAFGLPGKLVHGWYSVSMVASIIEKLNKMQVKTIDVQFAKPVMMPTTVNIEYLSTNDGKTPFRITSVNKKGDTVVHLTGVIG